MLLSFREFNNVCIGSLQPLLEYIDGKKNGYSLVSTSHDDNVYDEFTGCGEFEIIHCPTSEQIADILTKPLQGSQFIYLRDLLLGYKTP